MVVILEEKTKKRKKRGRGGGGGRQKGKKKERKKEEENSTLAPLLFREEFVDSFLAAPHRAQSSELQRPILCALATVDIPATSPTSLARVERENSRVETEA